MKRVLTAAALAAALSACSGGGGSDGKGPRGTASESADLRRYVDSEKGHRDRDASIAKAQKGTMAAFDARQKNSGIIAFEGVWISEAAALGGRQLQASISRDGVVFMEILDAAGASTQYAQGTATISGTEASGSLRQAKGDLAPLSRWRMKRTSRGVALSGGKISVFLTRRAETLT